MILALVRHAETVVDPARDPASWPLSPKGLADARELALHPRWKAVTRLASSTEPKAVSTAQFIAEATGITLETSPCLNEVERPSFQADYPARVARFFQCPEERCDDWETAAHALSRVQKFINNLDKSTSGEHIALVGHGMLWTLARAWLLGKEKADPKEWGAILTPDVSTWEIVPSGVTLVADFTGICR